MRFHKLLGSVWLTVVAGLTALGLFLAISYVLDGSFIAPDGLSVLVLFPTVFLSPLTSRPGWSLNRSILAGFALATAASTAALVFGTIQALSWRALLLVLLLLVWSVAFALNGIRLRILFAARKRRIAAQKALSSR